MRCTYKPPTAKMPPSACFWRFLKLRPRTTGMGRAMIMKSVRMLMAALVNHMAYWLMHFADFSLVQKARTGRQARMEPKSAQMVYRMTMAMVVKQANRNFGVGKTRRYWSRMEVLVSPRER